MNARRPTLVTLVAFAIAAGSCGGAAPTQPTVSPSPTAGQSPQAYLESMIGVMETNSINRFTINWADFRSRVMAEGAAARSIPEAFPAIRIALGLLADDHSFYLPAAGGAAISASSRVCAAPAAETPTVPAGVGYVRVGSFGGTGAEGIAFADGIQSTIRAADRDGLDGWIVDLRGNGGGNMWPMIAGLGPLLGDSLLGYFLLPVGQPVPWGYRDAGAWLAGLNIGPVTTSYALRQPAPRVAVLIDNRVASSGEATAIAFKARAGSRFFGTPTCGLSTANQNYDLNDGARLLLTVGVMADRARTKYGDSIAPDEVLPDSAQAVGRAIAWLQSGQ